MQKSMIKSKQFKKLLPQILELRESGYTPNKLITWLAEKGLELTPATYKLYLFRYSKEANSSNIKSVNVLNSISNDKPLESLSNDPEPNLLESDSNKFEFGTPQHKAKVKAETEELFRSSQKTGLRWDKQSWI